MGTLRSRGQKGDGGRDRATLASNLRAFADATRTLMMMKGRPNSSNARLILANGTRREPGVRGATRKWRREPPSSLFSKVDWDFLAGNRPPSRL